MEQIRIRFALRAFYAKIITEPRQTIVNKRKQSIIMRNKVIFKFSKN